MRRRTWALVRMSDVMFSHQVSLPSMIYEHDCDTQLPNNIFDDEFHPGSKELPPSRPFTEPTPIAYMIAKAKLTNELGNILQANNDINKHMPYDEVIRFDAKLRQIMQELPPHLKLGSLDGTHDPVTLLIARFNIDILCQKVFCILHRKYLPRARQNARYTHSRRSAVEASLRALDHLATLHKECQPNGRLRSVGWYVKSTATKDFTLPAMIVIMDLHYDDVARRASQHNEQEGAFLWSTEQRDKMITAVETARDIWKSLADTSMEAFKASKVIEIMLLKIKDDSQNKNGTSDVMLAEATTGRDPLQFPSPNTLSQNIFSPPPIMPDFSAGGASVPLQDNSAFMGMDFGLSPSGGGLNFNGGGMNMMDAGGAVSPFSLLGASAGGDMSSMNDLTNNFDWVSG